MKNLLLLLGFVVVGLGYSQSIQFESETIDYGNIEQGDNGERAFSFTNQGEQPLIINSVSTSCGCTVADYPKKPIMPGESGEIKVRYATTRIGSINKKIMVYSNALDGQKILKIIGSVKAK